MRDIPGRLQPDGVQHPERTIGSAGTFHPCFVNVFHISGTRHQQVHGGKQERNQHGIQQIPAALLAHSHRIHGNGSGKCHHFIEYLRIGLRLRHDFRQVVAPDVVRKMQRQIPFRTSGHVRKHGWQQGAGIRDQNLVLRQQRCHGRIHLSLGLRVLGHGFNDNIRARQCFFQIQLQMNRFQGSSRLFLCLLCRDVRFLQSGRQTGGISIGTLDICHDFLKGFLQLRLCAVNAGRGTQPDPGIEAVICTDQGNLGSQHTAADHSHFVHSRVLLLWFRTTVRVFMAIGN